MTLKLAGNHYGESHIRLLRVMRRGNIQEIKDLTLAIDFEGDFASAHTAGDNRKILPLETMKNTVYVLARQYPAEAIEEFVLHVVEHFLTYNPQLSRILVTASESPWTRIAIAEKPHASAFVSCAKEKRVTLIAATRENAVLRSGIDNLCVLKTAGATREGFLRDPYTLPEPPNPILSVGINVLWTHASPESEAPYSSMWHGVRQLLLETFASHESRSLQHTAYAMGQAVLANFDALAEIELSLADSPCLLVDLKPFGMENENEVFSPADEPCGSFVARLRRDS